MENKNMFLSVMKNLLSFPIALWAADKFILKPIFAALENILPITTYFWIFAIATTVVSSGILFLILVQIRSDIYKYNFLKNRYYIFVALAVIIPRSLVWGGLLENFNNIYGSEAIGPYAIFMTLSLIVRIAELTLIIYILKKAKGVIKNE